MAVILPGIGGQAESFGAVQSSPLLSTYSPRLFGAPPQLSHICDMRSLSSTDGNPGPVGDFYLTKILQDAQIANICVGRALFTGGMSSIANFIRVCGQYAHALKKYNIYGEGGSLAVDGSTAKEISIDAYNNAIASDDGVVKTVKASNSAYALTDLDDDTEVLDLSSVDGVMSYIDDIASMFAEVSGTMSAAMLTSLSVQQPFYTFESDWNTYINNVKMMINSAVIMLGLQDACVRVGDQFYPIGMSTGLTKESDVWANYRYITPTSGLGTITSVDTQLGDSSQYVSFMITPISPQESYSNQVGESQIYSSVINSDGGIGAEIAFITNSSQNAVDDAVVNIAGKATTVAESVLSALSGGAGRFTAAIAGSMARSYIGDHTIYPKIFQEHESNSSGVTLNVKLRSPSGDPYSYLINILVPMFFALGMALPKMSKNSAAAYCYPPIIQCNIPGVWGTRLGMVTSVDITKNPDSNDFSVHGYPLSVDLSIKVEDLQNVLVTSGMDKPALFLNNNTMFDYIAQCAGVDRYRVNGSIRQVTKLALAASASHNTLYNLGSGIMTDITTTWNRFTGTSRM